MQNKATTWYHLTVIRMVTMEKRGEEVVWQAWEEGGTLYTVVGGNVKW